MGHTQSSNSLSTVASESKVSLLRRKVSSLDSSLNKQEYSQRWKLTETGSSKHKISKLGSIRQKLVRKTRRGSDYRKHIRDLLQSWSSKEIQSFIRQYEALDALRDIHRLSDSGRKLSSFLPTDMAHLYENMYCSDLKIMFQGSIFHVHKAILCARCKLFDNYLTKESSDKDLIELNDEDFGYSSLIFSSLLKYIYSGFTKDRQLIEVLSDLARNFGMLNSFKNSMKEILDDSLHADLILVFPNMSQTTKSFEVEANLVIDNTLDVFCHSSILCARSSYFRSILQEKFRKRKASDKYFIVRLVLSEKIIPRTYLKVILHCMYTDNVDLSSVIKWKVADDGSGEADRLLTTVELAMELYEIGCFLDFPCLVSACEDIIVENFDASLLLLVFEWSSQPYGSKYVYRQAIHYFLEEFCMLCKVPLFLANIPKKILLRIISSDFLQATEEFILGIIVKWGEWQIAKSNEKPGTSPVNSLPRRSPKKRDINNVTLREIIADLLIHVRLRHILPTVSLVLQSVCQRRLLLQDFLFDIAETNKIPPSMVFWLREYRHPNYIRPRLFLPYFEEVKLVLHERVAAESSHSLGVLPSQCMPDMVPSNFTNEQNIKTYNSTCDSLSSNWVDITQLDPGLVKCIILREKELKTTSEVLRALALAPDSAEISTELELRVIREFGLPDELALHIFKQNPDLIEVDSSSGSSKQSTLSKVGLLMNNKQHNICSINTGLYAYDNPVLTYIGSYEHSVKSNDFQATDRPNLMLELSESTDSSLISHLIEDSPLDLPTHDQISQSLDIQLPNVLLDI